MSHLPSVIPRPGLALGRYPERRGVPANPLDDWFDRTAGSIYTRWENRQSNFEKIVHRIDEYGASLAPRSDDALSESVSDLRADMLLAGWNEDLAVRSFAVIRELSSRRLGLRHFESQLLGGWVMLQGKLAEMQTGEGKTITAALPAATAALCNVPVHVITANDYLAERDAEFLLPLYEALDLTVGVVSEGMDFQARRAAYTCDITYTTNKQIAFDYLRDRVQRSSTPNQSKIDLEFLYDQPSSTHNLMLRGLCFAIVDEADSVLIDEARTPLVLSRTLTSADLMAEVYEQALQLAGNLKVKQDFVLQPKERLVRLTSSGMSRLAQLSSPMAPPWNSIRQREELVTQALSALHLYVKDQDYVVGEDKIQLIDSNTGRIMADRSWEFGLQQLIETKEGCALSQQKETMARISYQRFFSRYLMLAGMSGTVTDVRQELASVYDLSVVTIPTHRPSRRVVTLEQVYSTSADAISAMLNNAREHVSSGRPVLIGTRSVEKSELLARLLSDAGFEVKVLNARQDKDEADIIKQAGKAGQITVATNMAGRGTDIALEDSVKANGGLHVIVFERNDAARLDRQLIGRCARQGDPGSYQIITSLEDELFTTYFGRWLSSLTAKLGMGLATPLSGLFWRGLMRTAQYCVERRHRQARRQVELEDTHLRSLLSFSGESE